MHTNTGPENNSLTAFLELADKYLDSSDTDMAGLACLVVGIRTEDETFVDPTFPFMNTLECGNPQTRIENIREKLSVMLATKIKNTKDAEKLASFTEDKNKLASFTEYLEIQPKDRLEAVKKMLKIMDNKDRKALADTGSKAAKGYYDSDYLKGMLGHNQQGLWAADGYITKMIAVLDEKPGWIDNSDNKALFKFILEKADQLEMGITSDRLTVLQDSSPKVADYINSINSVATDAANPSYAGAAEDPSLAKQEKAASIIIRFFRSILSLGKKSDKKPENKAGSTSHESAGAKPIRELLKIADKYFSPSDNELTDVASIIRKSVDPPVDYAARITKLVQAINKKIKEINDKDQTLNEVDYSRKITAKDRLVAVENMLAAYIMTRKSGPEWENGQKGIMRVKEDQAQVKDPGELPNEGGKAVQLMYKAPSFMLSGKGYSEQGMCGADGVITKMIGKLATEDIENHPDAIKRILIKAEMAGFNPDVLDQTVQKELGTIWTDYCKTKKVSNLDQANKCLVILQQIPEKILQGEDPAEITRFRELLNEHSTN